MDNKIEIILAAKDATAAAFKSATNRMNSFYSKLGILAGGYGLGKLADDFLKTASSFEVMEVKLDKITHGRGVETLDKLNKMALELPISTQQATNAFVTMAAMGLSPTEKSLRALIDVGSVFGDDVLKRISLQLGQAVGKGKLMAQDLNIMAEAGINARKYLKDAFGMPLAELQKSKIPIRRQIEAIFAGMEKQWGGTAKSMAHTWQGLENITRSYFTEIERQIMDAGAFDLIKDQLKDINFALSSWVKNNDALIRQNIPRYIKELKSGLQTIWDIISYDPAILEYGLAGLALGGKKGALLVGGMAHMAKWAKNLGAALGLVSAGIIDIKEVASANFSELQDIINRFDTASGLDKLDIQIKLAKQNYEDLYDQFSRPFPTATISQVFAAAEKIKRLERYRDAQASRLVPIGPVIDLSGFYNKSDTPGGQPPPAEDHTAEITAAYKKMYLAIGLQSVSAYNFEKKELEKQRDEFIRVTGDKLTAQKWFHAKLAQLEKKHAAAGNRALSESAAAYSRMYSDLGKTAAGWYDFQVAKITSERDEFVKATGDKALAAAWYNRQINKLLTNNSASAKKISQAWVEAMRNIQDITSSAFTGALTGELDSFEAYFSRFADSLSSIFAQQFVASVSADWKHMYAVTTGLVPATDQDNAMGYLGMAAAGLQAVKSDNSAQMIGTGIGMGIGLLIPGASPITGAIGASLGGMVGGLFGGGNNKPSDESIVNDLIATIKQNIKELQANTKALLNPADIYSEQSIIDQIVIKLTKGGKHSLASNLDIPGLQTTAAHNALFTGYEGLYLHHAPPEIISQAVEAYLQDNGVSDFISLLNDLTSRDKDAFREMSRYVMKIQGYSQDIINKVLENTQQGTWNAGNPYNAELGTSGFSATDEAAKAILESFTEIFETIKKGAMETANEVKKNLDSAANTYDEFYKIRYNEAPTQYNKTFKDFNLQYTPIKQQFTDTIDVINEQINRAITKLVDDYITEHPDLTDFQKINLYNAEKVTYFATKEGKQNQEILDNLNTQLSSINDLENAMVEHFSNMADDLMTSFNEFNDEKLGKITTLQKTFKDIYDSYNDYINQLIDLNAAEENLNTVRMAGMEALKNATKDYFASIKDNLSALIDNLQGGSLAPIQSAGWFQTKYTNLLNATNSPDLDTSVAAIKELNSFIPEYLGFMRTYSGTENYADIVNNVLKDIETLQNNATNVENLMLDELKSISFNTNDISNILQQIALGPGHFASGGYFSGGLRLVGEQGPELEVTGPSRIYSADDTMRMLTAAQNDNKEIHIHIEIDGNEIGQVVTSQLESNTDLITQIRRVAA